MAAKITRRKGNGVEMKQISLTQILDLYHLSKHKMSMPNIYNCSTLRSNEQH